MGPDVTEATFAYCTYYECIGIEFKPDLKKYQRRCPDCGHELTWREKMKASDDRKMKIRNCEHSIKHHEFIVHLDKPDAQNRIYKWERGEACVKCRTKKEIIDKGWRAW